MMVPALRPDVVDEPSPAAMEAFYADKANPRQRARILKYLARKEREKNGNAPRSAKRLGSRRSAPARPGSTPRSLWARGTGNCRNLDAVEMARFAGADVAQAVCGNEHHHCPAFKWCQVDGYKAGVMRASAADLVITAHNFITERLPQSIRAGAWAVVIDEEFATQVDACTDLTLESLGRKEMEWSPAQKADGTPYYATTEMLIEQFACVIEAFWGSVQRRLHERRGAEGRRGLRTRPPCKTVNCGVTSCGNSYAPCGPARSSRRCGPRCRWRSGRRRPTAATSTPCSAGWRRCCTPSTTS